MPTSARISLRGPIARLVAGAMLALVLALGHSAVAPRADDPPQPPPERRGLDEARLRHGAPWPGLQRTSGSYRDYLKQSTRYGDATLGYALLQHGILTKDRRLINSGLDGITYAIRRTGSLVSIESVFENMAVAGAYNLARNNLRGDKRFGRVNGAWARYLRRARATKVEKRDSYGNHYLPEAIAVLELMRSGLKSPDRRAIVGGGRARVRRAAIDLIVRRIPGMARREDWNLLGGRAFVLSDPPSRPPAYQGLSAGLYARALALLPGRPPAAARRRAPAHRPRHLGDDRARRRPRVLRALPGALLVAVLRGLRSGGGGLLPGSGAEEDARWQALSDRMIGRLRDAYGVGPNRLYVLPALRDYRGGFFRGRDGYVGATSFNGLTLLALDWGAGRSATGSAGRVSCWPTATGSAWCPTARAATRSCAVARCGGRSSRPPPPPSPQA
ncbi:MAG: hypothetical protein WKF40_06035 [Thermoleophilaceae bacterium]